MNFWTTWRQIFYLGFIKTRRVSQNRFRKFSKMSWELLSLKESEFFLLKSLKRIPLLSNWLFANSKQRLCRISKTFIIFKFVENLKNVGIEMIFWSFYFVKFNISRAFNFVSEAVELDFELFSSKNIVEQFRSAILA